MNDSEKVNIFYVSASSQKGFTMDPSQAIVDLTGAPVIAPGHVKNILAKQDRIYQRSLDVQRTAVKRIWNVLLDEMERYFELQEKFDLEFITVKEGSCPSERAFRESWGCMAGLIQAIAILEYGHDYKQDPKITLDKVAQMARVRYDQESE